MNPHIQDADLLRLSDGELSRDRYAAVSGHLMECVKCQARLEELERTADGFARLRKELPRPGPDGEARLRERLAGMRDVKPGNWGIALAAGVAVLGIWLVAERPARPDAQLTPGAALAMSREQVCAAVDDTRIIPASLAAEVFERYGIKGAKPRSYEMDYLITPALGGATDSRNLWPQPYTNGVWNARVKDALEDYLRGQVCQGTMDLAAAQAEIATDWIAAYRRHFQTARPLQAHLKFMKDRPWE